MHVILHTGQTPDWAAPLNLPWPLLPIGNRPWIEYWIEWCVAQEFRELQIILHAGAHEIESYLGDGSRWGVSFRYSFLRDPSKPDLFLRRDPARWSGGLCYLRQPLFPRRRQGGEAPARLPPDGACAYHRQGVCALFYSRDPATIAAFIRGASPAAAPFPPNALEPAPIESLQEYFALNMSLVSGEAGHYLTPGYRSQEGAYLGSNVIFPAAAHLVPPLIIGNDVRLRALCTVGPRAILGNRVIVDRQAEISDSIVLDGTYVGAGTEIQGRIVSGRRLIDPADGTMIDLDDSHLLAALRGADFRQEGLRHLVHRLAALLLLASSAPIALPALALEWLLGGRLRRDSRLGLRGRCAPRVWLPRRAASGWFERFSFDRWLTLYWVLRGDLLLCGQLAVRPEEQPESDTWPVYQPGVFTYADDRPKRDDPLLRRVEAAYYAFHRGWREDFHLLLRGWWGRFTRLHSAAENWVAAAAAMDEDRTCPPDMRGAPDGPALS
jgi:hypothetical protein